MLTAGERKTRFSMMGDEHGTWEVFTDDPYWIARLDKIATAYKTNGEGKWYKLTADQVLIHSKRQPPTEAQLQARREAGRKLHAH